MVYVPVSDMVIRSETLLPDTTRPERADTGPSAAIGSATQSTNANCSDGTNEYSTVCSSPATNVRCWVDSRVAGAPCSAGAGMNSSRPTYSATFLTDAYSGPPSAPQMRSYVASSNVASGVAVLSNTTCSATPSVRSTNQPPMIGAEFSSSCCHVPSWNTSPADAVDAMSSGL